MNSERKRGAMDAMALIIIAGFLLVIVIGIDKISFGAVRIEQTVQVSVNLDSRGSALYSFLNFGNEMKNMELLGNMYANTPIDTKQLETVAEKLYGSLYMLKTTIPKKDVVLGKVDMDKSTPGVAAEFPVPGAGKSGAIKNSVVIIS